MSCNTHGDARRNKKTKNLSCNESEITSMSGIVVLHHHLFLFGKLWKNKKIFPTNQLINRMVFGQ